MITPRNVAAVFMAGVVWVLMLGYWILVCVSVYEIVNP